MITTIKTWFGDIMMIDKQLQPEEVLAEQVYALGTKNAELATLLQNERREAAELQEACRYLRGVVTKQTKEIKCLTCRLDHSSSQYLELIERVKALLQ